MDEDFASSKFGCFGPSKSTASPSNASKGIEMVHSRTNSRTSLSLKWWNSTSVTDQVSQPPVDIGFLDDEESVTLDMFKQMQLDPSSKTATQASIPTHERKLSWPFSSSRKVVPQPTKQADDPSSCPSHGAESSHSSHSAESPTSLEAFQQTDNVPKQPDSDVSTDSSRPQAYRRLWQSITSVRKGDKISAPPPNTEEYTVENLARGILSLKPTQHIMEAPRLVDGLAVLDSRAVAALLKELAKSGAPHRASELFDYLRSLPETNELSSLVDLYTYTTIISQCGSHHHLRRALELIAEMRGKGIQCNIHTYSALMSVCVKCNECELALDVYDQLQAEGCTANLVTYNILIDAYSRTGQWARAVEVLDPISKSGLTPEARTYNAVISACGKAGQPDAAMRVYERMLADGVEPTGTTYTSVISAYGRAGKVEEAMKVYQDMSKRNCEPNVITYSSLITVCERAGRAELALSLYDDMLAAGVRPNTVTFNGLIAACGHGGMWEKAMELADSMGSAGCRPDGATYSVLLAALERGGQWRQAVQTLEKAQGSGLRPDAGAYNSAIGALWSSGRLPAQRKAIQLLTAAQRQGSLHLQTAPTGESTCTVHSPGAAILLTLKWLANFRDGLSAAAAVAVAANPSRTSLLLARGKHAPLVHSYEPAKDTITAMFAAFSVPATVTIAPQGLVIAADARMLPSWTASASGLALLSVFDYANIGPVSAAAALLKEDRAVALQCGKAFAAVRQFETARATVSLALLESPEASFIRRDIIACITALSSGLQLREETAHDAVQFCDALLGRATPSEQPPPPACAAALLLLACRQASNASAVLRHGQLALQAAGLPISVVLEAEQRIVAVLGPNPSAISPLRVLQLYMERMGCDINAVQKCQLAQVMTLAASGMVAKAAIYPVFSRFDPSIVAAGCLLKARESMGLAPAWPMVLQEMTNFDEGSVVTLTQCTELLSVMGVCS